MRLVFFSLFMVLLYTTCEREEDLFPKIINTNYQSENVFVIVVDGPRFSETWGDADHEYIPNLYNRLSNFGVYNEEFYNYGATKTIPGHTAIITGVYESLHNNGLQFPTYPSFMQQWLSITRKDPTKAWIISSKKKLEVLGDCSHLDWRGNYKPSVDAAERKDVMTYQRIKEVLNQHHPNLLFVNLRGPDSEGHAENWPGYIDAIRITDSIFNDLYDFVQNDSLYAGKTTIILTNDHGRHLDEIQSGFRSHGDQCLGCTHINFYATGPDLKQGVVLRQEREQIDIAPTVARLMGFEIADTEGNVMQELFK